MPARTSIEAELVTNNRNTRAPLSRNQYTVTSTGAVCQQLEHAQLHSCRYEQIPRKNFNFNYEGFPGGVPVKHRKIRRVNPAGVSAFGLTKRRQRCLFFFVVSGAGALMSSPRRTFAVIVQEQDA